MCDCAASLCVPVREHVCTSYVCMMYVEACWPKLWGRVMCALAHEWRSKAASESIPSSYLGPSGLPDIRPHGNNEQTGQKRERGRKPHLFIVGFFRLFLCTSCTINFDLKKNQGENNCKYIGGIDNNKRANVENSICTDPQSST